MCNRKLIYLPVVVILSILTSCYPEWRLARSYIDSDPGVSILVMPANYIFKKNLKVDELDDTTGFSRDALDSALMANSVFLQRLSDSIFLEAFVNSMIDEFIGLGYRVYTENMLDSFLFAQGPAYFLNIAQIELEEHYNVHEDKQEYGEYVYYKHVDMNAITYNFWFELSELNDESAEPKLFFASETINDVVYGYFSENLFTGDIKYLYDVDELDMDIVYNYAAYFGRRYAGYTFDYLMNRYVEEQWPQEKTLRYYMHYKRENNTLDPTINDRFLEMKQE
jgi:hypothetical protein